MSSMRFLFSMCLILSMNVCAHVFAAPHPSAVPSGPSLEHLMEFPKSDLLLLLELLENPDEKAAALLDSDDPEEIGLGIFIASFSGDIDRLLAVRDLVFDDRKTIPGGVFRDAGDSTKMSRTDHTVGERLVLQYRQWFGLSHQTVDQVHAEAARIAGRGLAWEYAHAWRNKYLVAMSNVERVAVLNEVKSTPDDIGPLQYARMSWMWRRRAAESRADVVDEIIAHPDETLRLFVAREISQYDSDVRHTFVRRILDSLSPQTRQAIRERSLVYPPDSVFHLPMTLHPSSGEGIYGWYESITRQTE